MKPTRMCEILNVLIPFLLLQLLLYSPSTFVKLLFYVLRHIISFSLELSLQFIPILSCEIIQFSYFILFILAPFLLKVIFFTSYVLLFIFKTAFVILFIIIPYLRFCITPTLVLALLFGDSFRIINRGTFARLEGVFQPIAWEKSTTTCVKISKKALIWWTPKVMI